MRKDNHITIQVTLPTIKEAAKKIISHTQGKTIIAFHGEMGAGKTTLIKAICEQFGITDAINSPTFSIINEYGNDTNRRIYHFDFYRLDDNDGKREAADLGIDDYFYSGALCFIEWPEKLEGTLPEETVHIYIYANGDDSRSVEIF